MLSLLDPAFQAAHSNACDKLMAATREFELVTGRSVSHVQLRHEDITTMQDKSARILRVFTLSFAPAPEDIQ
jgi:hypothetical protein